MTARLNPPSQEDDCVVSALEEGWQKAALAQLYSHGYAKVVDAVGDLNLRTTERAIYGLRDRTIAEVGEQKFADAAGQGFTELRMPFVFDSFFFQFLEIPALLSLLHATLGESAILRFQNVIWSQAPTSQSGVPLTHHLHQNFKFYLPSIENGRVLVEFAFPIGAQPIRFDVIPGSQHLAAPPTEQDVAQHGRTLSWHEGEMIIFDPFVWHRERPGDIDQPSLSIFQQFSRPFIKPHADYCRAIEMETFNALAERTQRLLGKHARLPTSLKDFYLPEEQRPYRSGQW